MEILPAIDIKNKQVVRLFNGDYDKVTVYDVSPIATAKKFKELGANWLHVVDLDGAKDGELSNFDIIKQITQDSGLFVEVGGGIRDEERIKQYLDVGVSRVILGTVAVNNFEFVKEMVNKYGDKIAVGVDAFEQKVAICGWKIITEINSFEFCDRLAKIGVKTIIYTDITKDGALIGTNLQAYKELTKIDNLNVIASGGITYYDEILKLNQDKLYGAILGKALYSGTLDLTKAIKLAEEQC